MTHHPPTHLHCKKYPYIHGYTWTHIAVWARASSFRRFTDTNFFSDPVPLRYGKLATKYPWIYGYVLQCMYCPPATRHAVARFRLRYIAEYLVPTFAAFFTLVSSNVGEYSWIFTLWAYENRTYARLQAVVISGKLSAVLWSALNLAESTVVDFSGSVVVIGLHRQHAVLDADVARVCLCMSGTRVRCAKTAEPFLTRLGI